MSEAPTLAWVVLMLAMMIAGLLFGGVVALAVRRGRRVALPTIPRGELAALGTTIRQADDLAARGEVREGYACLMDGLRRAESARGSGTP